MYASTNAMTAATAWYPMNGYSRVMPRTKPSPVAGVSADTTTERITSVAHTARSTLVASSEPSGVPSWPRPGMPGGFGTPSRTA
ncbi:MAG: hypothetical protein R3E97_04090 [Candidatus Eisenbacteria bacterium]